MEPLVAFLRLHWPAEISPETVTRTLLSSTVFVELDRGGLIGMIAVLPMGGGAAYVTHLCVAPPHRGKGVARRLIANAYAMDYDSFIFQHETVPRVAAVPHTIYSWWRFDTATASAAPAKMTPHVTFSRPDTLVYEHEGTTTYYRLEEGGIDILESDASWGQLKHWATQWAPVHVHGFISWARAGAWAGWTFVYRTNYTPPALPILVR